MRPLVAFLILLLSACGAGESNPSGGGSAGVSSVATLSSTPAPEAFSVARGGTATLSIAVTRKSPDVARLELSTVIGPDGIDVSPSAYTFDFEETGEERFTHAFAVTVDTTISNPEPHFYIYAKALDSRGRSVGSETLRLKYQWGL